MSGQHNVITIHVDPIKALEGEAGNANIAESLVVSKELAEFKKSIDPNDMSSATC
jgi:hypothetical protein